MANEMVATTLVDDGVGRRWRRCSSVGDGGDGETSLDRSYPAAGDCHRIFKRPRYAADQQQRAVCLNNETGGDPSAPLLSRAPSRLPPRPPTSRLPPRPPTTSRPPPSRTPSPPIRYEKTKSAATAAGEAPSEETLLRRAMMLDRFKDTIVKAEVQLLHINDRMKEATSQALLKEKEQQSYENRRWLREAARRNLKKMEEEAAERINKELLILPENLWFLGSTHSDYRPLSPSKWSSA